MSALAHFECTKSPLVVKYEGGFRESLLGWLRLEYSSGPIHLSVRPKSNFRVDSDGHGSGHLQIEYIAPTDVSNHIIELCGMTGSHAIESQVVHTRAAWRVVVVMRRGSHVLFFCLARHSTIEIPTIF